MMLWSKGCAMTGDMLSGFQNGAYVNLPFWNEGKGRARRTARDADRDPAPGPRSGSPVGTRRFVRASSKI